MADYDEMKQESSGEGSLDLHPIRTIQEGYGYLSEKMVPIKALIKSLNKTLGEYLDAFEEGESTCADKAVFLQGQAAALVTSARNLEIEAMQVAQKLYALSPLPPEEYGDSFEEADAGEELELEDEEPED